MTSAIPTRDERARAACRTLGGHMAAFVTGDPSWDDVAEYLGAGWVRIDDHYREDDETDDERVPELAHQLAGLGAALTRLADDVRAGRATLGTFRAMAAMSAEPLGTGAELDAITRDLDATTTAWAAAGHPFDGPEFEAREAVFRRLRAWNEARARRYVSGIPDNRPPD